MNLDTLHIKRFTLVCLLASGLKAHAQETTLKFTPDTSFFTTIALGRYQPGFNYIYHYPDKKDEQRFKKYKYLIGQKPTSKNYELYYYNCGTGFHRQQDEYDFLYASCYEGLSRHKDVIELLLPSCLDRNDEIIVTAIKNTYSKTQIQEYLQKAETSIKFSLDTFPSFAYQPTYSDTNKEKTDTLTYYSGTATIMLFDRQINMPIPNVENGERLTREKFIKLFKESDFYTRLKDDT